MPGSVDYEGLSAMLLAPLGAEAILTRNVTSPSARDLGRVRRCRSQNMESFTDRTASGPESTAPSDITEQGVSMASLANGNEELLVDAVPIFRSLGAGTCSTPHTTSGILCLYS